MATTTFRIDNFKPWDSSHCKSQFSSHTDPDQAGSHTCSGVEILPSTPGPARQPGHQPDTQEHPLPLQPPAEVCTRYGVLWERLPDYQDSIHPTYPSENVEVLTGMGLDFLTLSN